MITGQPSQRWVTSHPAVGAFYSQCRVLVIGADGFLGSNCVYALQELGAKVSLLTRRSWPRVTGFSGQVFRGDLRDHALMRSVVTNQDLVFDFAGGLSAVASNAEPQRSLEEDCQAHLSLLQACTTLHQAPVVVFCSSRLVYGKPQYLPVDEAHPLGPQSLYAVHKITVENYLQVFRQLYGLRFCVLRLSNPYGPHQAPEARRHGILNQFVQAAAAATPITIYGDGGQQRDYIYVDDVIAVFLLCAMHEHCYGQTFNLGGRHSISLGSAAQLVAQLAGGTPVHFVPWPQEYQAVETGDYCTDLSKIDRYLTLPPQTSLAEGLARTLDHYRKTGGMSSGNEPSAPGTAGQGSDGRHASGRGAAAEGVCTQHNG